MPITFSEQFNISKEVLEITGVFDVILDIDTRVFIDPALLELCTEPEFLDARKKVEKYFSDIITLLITSWRAAILTICWGASYVVKKLNSCAISKPLLQQTDCSTRDMLSVRFVVS